MGCPEWPAPAVIAAGAVFALVRFAAGIGKIANINNAYPWGWWVGYGIMTMIAIGGALAFSAIFVVWIIVNTRRRPA